MDQQPSRTDHTAEIEAAGRIAAIPTILDVVCRTTGMGFAAVARVTEDRWIACNVRDHIDFGLQPGGELQVQTTICHEVRQLGAPVIINHAAEDGVYCGHPTPAMYGFQSYISVPITLPDGTFFGTLCAIDPKPRMLDTPEIISSFKLFAELIAFHLDANLRIAESQRALQHEQETALLREQFIAVLGHDLRNPLAAVGAGARLMLKYPDRGAELVGQINRSVSRMAGLIDNVLDFARGRLGNGLTLDCTDQSIEPTLTHVVQELRSSHPDRTILVEFALAPPVRCDQSRVAQLLSNLLGNALTHGAATAPVHVRASSNGGMFELSVANAGEPIVPAAMENLFQPFFRAAVREHQQGLGLGLYIAAEIARAHGGSLDVTSTSAETRFTFRMPTGV